MDKSEAIKIVQRYLSNVSGKYQIENAIIFGSFAKGKQKYGSDIDILYRSRYFERCLLCPRNQ